MQKLDLNRRAEKFVANIVEALNITAPMKKYKIPKIWEKKKWYSEEIEIATMRRDEAYVNAVYNDTEQD